MTSLQSDFKNKLNNLSVFEKIMALNVVVFLVGLLIHIFGNMPRFYALSWLALPSRFLDVILQPWSLLTYGFVHYDFYHLLFNLVVLYFVSRTMINLFPSKQALNIYFLGIIAGGLAYLTIYNILPNSYSSSFGSLVGASAGVNALLIFLCTYMPNRETRFFSISIKLWYIGAAIVIFDILGLFGVNQGGKIAHLGGSLLGYIYAKKLITGTDIGTGFGKFMDSIANLFVKKSTLKTVHKTKNRAYKTKIKSEPHVFNNQKKVDMILDKISKSGYDSLTKAEKTFLFKAGEE